MALNIKQGVLTANTSNGNQTITLDTGFNPKAIIVWTTHQTATGAIEKDGVFAYGFASYHASTAASRSQAWLNLDAQATIAATAFTHFSRLLSYNPGALAAATVHCALSSMTSNTVVINWTAAPASAILVHYFIIGGDSVTDAYVEDFVVSADGTTANTTVTSGFGKPDLLFWFSGDRQGAGDGVAGAGFASFGAGFDEANAVEASLKTISGGAVVDMAAFVRTDAHFARWAGNSPDGYSLLDARVNWPTDGFRYTKPDAYSLANQPSYLALRLAADCGVTVGRSATITSGSTLTLPGVAGKAPKGVLLFHCNVPVSAGWTQTNGDLAYFGMGGSDGTTVGHAGTGDDDNNADSQAMNTFSTSKVLQMYVQSSGAGTLESEASVSFSGSDAILAFNDLDSVARAFAWVVLSGSGQTVLPDADLAAGGWTTAPLFSKLNDSSDATLITATAS